MSTVRSPRWRALAAGALLVVVACAVLPLETAGLVAELASVAGMVALYRGSRRNGAPDLFPFRLIVAGGAAFLAANAIRAVVAAVTGDDNPFPSIADPVYFVGYTLMIVGVVGLVRRRSAQVEGDNALDALLVATSIGVVTLLFVVQPFMERSDVGMAARVITLLYTLFDLLLVSGIIRLAVGSGRRSPSYYLLGAASACAVLTDVFITMSASSTAGQRLSVTVGPLSFLLAGAAGLHPSVARLTDPPELRDIQLTPRRMFLLYSAVVGMVALLVGFVVAGDDSAIWIAGVGSLAAVLIVLGRLALLVHANERKAEREAMLRDGAGALASSTSVRGMYATAANVVASLVGQSSALVIELKGAQRVVAATAGLPLPAEVVDAVLARAGRDRLDWSTGVCVADTDGPAGQPKVVLATPVSVRRGNDAILIAATDEGVARQILHAMETLGIQLAGAVDGLLLAEEIYRQEQEQRFRALIEHSSDLVSVLDEDGLVTFASPASMQLLGLKESQLIGRHPFERVHPDDRFEASSLLDRSWAVPGVLDPIEVRFQNVSGEWRWFEVLVENLQDQPEVGAVIIHSRDVTDRRRAQEELSAREARFRSLVQHNADLIAIVDDDLRLTYVSPAARGMLGYEPDSLVGRSITDLIPADQLFVDNEMLPSLSEALVRDATGQWRTVELTITDLRGDEAVGGIVINARDVSERKTLESKLRHLAMHDPLTGLANRNLLHDRLAQALDTADNDVAVLYVDIDDFKALNDSLGHGYGDTALCEIARRLTAGIRGTDLAARIGGDEFAVILEGPGAQTPMEVGERLLDAVRAPIRLGPHRVKLTVSLGAAVRDADSTVSTLTRNADIAMYLAKTDGKDRRQLFEDSMLESFNERIELKRDLQEVIKRGELRLVYQPVYNIRSGEMTSVEALVRWDHPTRGLVSPLQFIPLAEESGNIREIGAWVLDEACRQLAEWRRAGAPSSLKMGVNLSVSQLEEDGLIGQVERTLLNHGLDPDSLILEVTESVLAANVDLVQLQLSGLSSLGVRLALDDFGTGYSSLGYLQHFQLDTLKIDKAFLGESADPAQQEGLLRAIIDLAGNRGMATTAEGVEDEGQLAVLAKLGCTSVQGYLFAKPLPPADVLGAAANARPYLEVIVRTLDSAD